MNNLIILSYNNVVDDNLTTIVYTNYDYLQKSTVNGHDTIE
jgi:hypothetical protein